MDLKAARVGGADDVLRKQALADSETLCGVLLFRRGDRRGRVVNADARCEGTVALEGSGEVSAIVAEVSRRRSTYERNCSCDKPPGRSPSNLPENMAENFLSKAIRS